MSGSGFGPQAIALALATHLHEQPACPPEVRDRIIDAVLAAAPDQAAPYPHPLNQQPVPDDERALCLQLAPALIAHPANPALGAAALWALTQLWPHVAADERPLLRTSLLNTLARRGEDEGAQLTALQLRDWQKQVPTHFGTLQPSVTSLRGVFGAKDGLAAYLLLVEHLGSAVDLETLCWVLGTLSIGMLQHLHDPQGELAEMLLGTTACEHLVPLLPAEALVTIVSQLNHRLWWLNACRKPRPIRQSLDTTQRPLGLAVATGDITVVQRSARVLATQQPTRFWDEMWQQIAGLLPLPDPDLRRLLIIMETAHWRAEDGAIAVKDASAIAALLGDLAWARQQRGS